MITWLLFSEKFEWILISFVDKLLIEVAIRLEKGNQFNELTFHDLEQLKKEKSNLVTETHTCTNWRIMVRISFLSASKKNKTC